MPTYTPHYSLGKPNLGETNWTTTLNSTIDQIDTALSATTLGSLVTTDVMNSTINTSINNSVNGLGVVSQTIGTSGGSLSNTSGAGLALIMEIPFNGTGPLNSVSMTFASANGTDTFEILLLNSTGNGNFSVVDKWNVVPAATSTHNLQTFVAGVDFTSRNVTSGQYIGIYGGTGSVTIAYQNGGTSRFFYYYTAGDPGTISRSYSTGTVSYLDISATYTSSQVVSSPLATQSYVNNSVKASNRTLLHTETFNSSSTPANWVSSSGVWSSGSGLVSPSSGQGYTTSFTYQQSYALTQRTFHVVFEILSSNTILGLGSIAQNYTFQGAPYWTSLFVVDSSANTISITSSPNGSSSSPTVLASSPLGFTVTTGNKYLLAVTVNERQVTATVTDPISGITASVTYGNNNSDTGAGGTWGAFDDYSGFFAIAGQFKIDSFSILANTVHPRVLFLGDSLTWGYELMVPQRWASLVGSQTNSYAVSGRPGDTSYGVLARMTSEVALVMPKYVVVLVGTNDATTGVTLSNYETNINSIVAKATSLGVSLIFCAIPTCGYQQNTINSMNAYLLSLGLPIVRFDLASSTGYNGTTQNTSLFQSDNVHFNVNGSIAVANRFQIDAYWIYD